MKNTFKLMGIALLAGAMLFAGCKKDEEKNDNGGNNDNPPVDNPYVKVTFGANTSAVSWEATSVMGDNYASAGLLEFGAFKNYESESAPYVQGYFRNSVGAATHSQQDYYYFFYYENENDYTIDETGELSGDPGAVLPNWQPKTGMQQEVTAIDLNAQTISATVTGQLFHLPEYIQGQEVISALSIIVNKATWESTGKAMRPMAIVK